MSLRTQLLIVADAVRAIAGPDQLDQRPTKCTIYTYAWSGGFRKAGTKTTLTTTEVPRYTKIRHITQREIASSGGRYEQGDVVVGPITPEHAGGGMTEAQLAQTVTENGIEVVYRLEPQAPGGIDGEYQLIELRRDRAYRYEVVVGRRLTTP